MPALVILLLIVPALGRFALLLLKRGQPGKALVAWPCRCIEFASSLPPK